jgi:hypothetical protein
VGLAKDGEGEMIRQKTDEEVLEAVGDERRNNCETQEIISLGTLLEGMDC